MVGIQILMSLSETAKCRVCWQCTILQWWIIFAKCDKQW